MELCEDKVGEIVVRRKICRLNFVNGCVFQCALLSLLALQHLSVQ